MLASLEERSTHEEFDYFLEVGHKDGLEEDNLVDKATRDRFALFWWAIVLPVEEALPCFRSETQEPLFLLALHSGIHSHISSSNDQ